MFNQKNFECYKFFIVKRIIKIKINNVLLIVIIDIVNIILIIYF